MLKEVRDYTDVASAEIVVGSTPVAEAWMFDRGSEDNVWLTAATSAVVPCEAGEEVWVRAGATPSSIGGTDTLEGTQFVGYLVALT